MVMSRTWRFSQILVLVAVVLLLVALAAALGKFGVKNWEAWATVALAVFVASFLPWKSGPTA
jgi:hypothetical protein